jgi:hypothetical protein
MKLIIICLLLTVSELRKKRLFVLDSPSLSDLVFYVAMTRYLPLQEKGTGSQGPKEGDYHVYLLPARILPCPRPLYSKACRFFARQLLSYVVVIRPIVLTLTCVIDALKSGDFHALRRSLDNDINNLCI